MRSGDRCGMLPRQVKDATEVAKVLKGRRPARMIRSVGSADPVRMLGAVRSVAGSNVDRIVAGSGRLEERIAYVLLEAARPAIAGPLVAMAVVFGGFLAVGDLPGWLSTVARLLLVVGFGSLLYGLGRKLRQGPPHLWPEAGPMTVPSEVLVLWLALMPWLLAVWLAGPLVFGWFGASLPFTLSGVVLTLTLVSALVLSVRRMLEIEDASWRSRVAAMEQGSAVGENPAPSRRAY